MNITKILLSIIAAIMIVTNTNATTMCVTNDNTNIILDPSVDGESYTSDREKNTWEVVFSYGKISGVSTCNGVSGNLATAYPEYNNSFSQGTTGENCWCRMITPVRSAWVFRVTRSADSQCASDCASDCGLRFSDKAVYRTALYNSAGN